MPWGRLLTGDGLLSRPQAGKTTRRRFTNRPHNELRRNTELDAGRNVPVRIDELLTMRVFSKPCVARAVLPAALVLLASCASTHPQQFRTYLLPPSLAPAVTVQPIADTPPEVAYLYANELPSLNSSLPNYPRPSDTEFLIKRADGRYLAGKKALQDGRLEDARTEFNAAIDILLSAPEDAPEHVRIEQRLQD